MCPVILAGLGIGSASAAIASAGSTATLAALSATGSASAAIAAGSAAAASAASTIATVGTVASVGSALAAVGSTAGTIAGQVNQQKSAKNQQTLANQSAALQTRQIAAQAQADSEASAGRALELSRASLIAKGQAKASGLGDRSVRAIGRSIGFDLGSDLATLERNQQLGNLQSNARLQGINLDLNSQRQQIGDTSGLGLGLQIGGTLANAGGQALGKAANSRTTLKK